jgi:acyl carrier protein
MDVKQKIADILVEKLGIATTEVTPEANLIKDLGIDSLDYAELIMEFEQEFNIRIPDNDAEQLQTVSEIVQYVERMCKKEGNSTSAL